MANIKKAEIYRREAAAGLSCGEIARKYGVSSQAVCAAVGSMKEWRFQEWTPQSCIWPGLRQWLNHNRIGKRALLRKMGLEYSHCNMQRLHGWMSGRTQMRMPLIKQMMTITGLPFEELFRDN